MSQSHGEKLEVEGLPILVWISLIIFPRTAFFVHFPQLSRSVVCFVKLQLQSAEAQAEELGCQ